jgi:hypothetical protein
MRAQPIGRSKNPGIFVAAAFWGVTLLVFSVAWPGCHRNQVRLQVAPGVNRFEWRKPASLSACRARCQKLLYVVDLPIGYARGRARRVEGFVFNARMRWNVAVRPVCEEFEGLCERHNNALISVQEFEQRRQELLSAVGELADRRQRLDMALQAYEAARSELTDAQGEVPASRVRSSLERARSDADDIIRAASELASRTCET